MVRKTSTMVHRRCCRRVSHSPGLPTPNFGNQIRSRRSGRGSLFICAIVMRSLQNLGEVRPDDGKFGNFSVRLRIGLSKPNQLRGDLQFRDFGSPLKWAKSKSIKSGSVRGSGRNPPSLLGSLRKARDERMFCEMSPIAAGSEPCLHLRSAPEANSGEQARHGPCFRTNQDKENPVSSSYASPNFCAKPLRCSLPVAPVGISGRKRILRGFLNAASL
jgi:hypothetical protein